MVWLDSWNKMAGMIKRTRAVRTVGGVMHGKGMDAGSGTSTEQGKRNSPTTAFLPV